MIEIIRKLLENNEFDEINENISELFAKSKHKMITEHKLTCNSCDTLQT